MTNNDELATNLKAAAEKAMPAIEKYEAGEIDGDDALEMLSDFTDVINPSNILALLAERDADKKRIAELEARTVSVKLPKASTKRRNWTTWDWIEHLGGRYQNGNPSGYIEFGSVYAVQQMLKQFARTVYAQCQSDVVAQIEKQLAESGIKLEVGE